MLDLRELVGLAGAPVVVALVEICKRWVTDDRWWPIIAVVWAIALNEALAYVLKTDYAVAAIVGLVTGLAASGLYSQMKASRKALRLRPRG